jgi:SPP1 family predicted phage head-tail adaptor
VKAGQLDRRVQLLRRTITRGTGGEALEAYADAGTEWAARLPLTAREIERDAATQGQAEVKFRIRHRADVKAEWRCVCEGVTYDITGIEELGRREGLHLFARGAVE